MPGEPGVRAPAEVALVLRTLWIGFAALPAGGTLECRVRPLGASGPTRSHPASPESSRWMAPRQSAPPSRSGPSPAPRSANASVPEEGLLWSAEVVFRSSSSADGTLERRAVGLAEASWRRLDGRGIRFGSALRPAWFDPPFYLTDVELLALLPYRDLPSAAAGRAEMGPSGIPLGRDPGGRVVRLPASPLDGRHAAILGETGMGKSSLLVGLALRAADRATVIVLDPLGETARAIRDELAIPRERVLYLSAASGAPSLNALEGIGAPDGADPVRAERRIDDIVHALRRVRAGRYAAGPYWGPRIEEMLTRAVEVAAGFPGGTLIDAHTVLATAGRTRRVVPPELRERLGELADRIRERPEDADGARRLLHEVVRNRTLRRTLCASAPTVALRDLVAPGRVVLIAGDAATVGEATARYLLAVDLALLWSELLARDDVGKVYLLLDEVQWYAHDSLAEMLQLARRKNVHVIFATQALAALPENVRQAAWTNVADFVAFRGSPEEARELAALARGVPAGALTSIPRGTALSLLGKGESARWVRTVRLPPMPAGKGEGEDPDSGSHPPPTPPPRGQAPGNRPGDLLGAIVARAASRSDGRLLRLPLAELPGSPDPAAPALRAVGRRLGRAGALVRVERGADGPVWWIDPDRLAQLALTAPGPASVDASSAELPPAGERPLPR